MRQLLRLYLPTLIPSWRFFQDIGPSARIEYRLLLPEATEWKSASSRPEMLGALTYLRRLFWNPDWNEHLFLTTCAERLVLESSRHAEAEINARLVRRHGLSNVRFQFRLVFLWHDGTRLTRSVEHESAPVDAV